jgi:hypothetical protein
VQCSRRKVGADRGEGPRPPLIGMARCSLMLAACWVGWWFVSWGNCRPVCLGEGHGKQGSQAARQPGRAGRAGRAGQAPGIECLARYQPLFSSVATQRGLCAVLSNRPGRHCRPHIADRACRCPTAVVHSVPQLAVAGMSVSSDTIGSNVSSSPLWPSPSRPWDRRGHGHRGRSRERRRSCSGEGSGPPSHRSVAIGRVAAAPTRLCICAC